MGENKGLADKLKNFVNYMIRQDKEEDKDSEQNNQQWGKTRIFIKRWQLVMERGKDRDYEIVKLLS